MEIIEKYSSYAIGYIIAELPGFLSAVAILFLGLWIVKRLTKVLKVTLEKSGFTIEIISFLVAVANIAMKVLLLVSVAGMVGINTAAFVGVLAATGLAIGLALQGSLGNFAAGIIIVTFKPYKVGDWIEVKDKFGKVQDIHIFNTVLVSPGSKTLIIPNGEVINNVITNFSKRGNLRVELKIRLPYGEDFPVVKGYIMEQLLSMENVLKYPEPEIGIEEFGENSLMISVRPYVKPDMYWTVYYEVMAALKLLYHEKNISVAHSENITIGKVGK